MEAVIYRTCPLLHYLLIAVPKARLSVKAVKNVDKTGEVDWATDTDDFTEQQKSDLYHTSSALLSEKNGAALDQKQRRFLAAYCHHAATAIQMADWQAWNPLQGPDKVNEGEDDQYDHGPKEEEKASVVSQASSSMKKIGRVLGKLAWGALSAPVYLSQRIQNDVIGIQFGCENIGDGVCCQRQQYTVKDSFGLGCRDAELIDRNTVKTCLQKMYFPMLGTAADDFPMGRRTRCGSRRTGFGPVCQTSMSYV